MRMLMAGTTWIVVLMVGSLLATAPGAESHGGDLEVQQVVIARGVEDRRPVGEATSFPADVGQLICFTKILGASEETSVEHIWFHEGTERARVRLTVRSPAWRTWSSKQIQTSWTGDWKVEIRDSAGNLLDKLRFRVEDREGQGNAG